MPRRPRICPAGTCFHVLNRAVARLPLFEKREDFEAFERVLLEAFEREKLPILAYCVMSNHWHFVVQPRTDRQLTDFFRWLTHTHTMRWHAHYQTQGTGHLYQGRFKAFPIEEDEHLLAVLRYVAGVAQVLEPGGAQRKRGHIPEGRREQHSAARDSRSESDPADLGPLRFSA